MVSGGSACTTTVANNSDQALSSLSLGTLGSVFVCARQTDVMKSCCRGREYDRMCYVRIGNDL